MENDEELSFNIYFCNEYSHLRSVTFPAIFFRPADERWNDFLFKCAYEYVIDFGDEHQKIEGRVFLGFLSTEAIAESNDRKIPRIAMIDSNGRINPRLDLVDSSGRISPTIDMVEAYQLPEFFTLQGGMHDYRDLISKHGVKDANRFLLALNDLVASKRIPKRAKLVVDAMNTEVFKLAFMRDAERFFAFHNADSVLDGLEWESFSGISTQLSLSYELAAFPGEHQFKLNFDTESILPKRICVLIGRNGLGKSQALRTIVNSLTKGDPRFSERELKTRPRISRLLAIATPGETIYTFPPERPNKRIKYRRLILSRSAKSKSSRGFCDLCVQLARSEEFIGENYRWDLFKESIQFFPNINNIVIPLSKPSSASAGHIVKVKGKHYVPLVELNKGGEQARLEISGAILSNANPLLHINGNIFPLSSGQLAFIKFVVQACLFVENGTLVLLDEPETHLHPNFISKFVRVLDRLLKLTGSIAIIATHSAYFVREVPKTQVLVFKNELSGQLRIQNPRLKTFGADIGAISFFVFEDEITNALVEDILSQFPQNKEEQKSLLRDLKAELSADVLMYIRRKLNLEVDSEED